MPGVDKAAAYEALFARMSALRHTLEALAREELRDEHRFLEIHWLAAVYKEQLNVWWGQLCQLMPYASYLATGHWHTVRKEALRRALYRCQLCNAAGPLQVHHRTYAHLGWEDEHLTDLIALCGRCHAKHHNKIPNAPGV